MSEYEILNAAVSRLDKQPIAISPFRSEEQDVRVLKALFHELSRSQRQNHDVRIARTALKDCAYERIHGSE